MLHPSSTRLLAQRLQLALLLAALVGSLCASDVWAQAAGKEEKLLPPESVSLRTRDGVRLSATYWPSKLGKNAVPVVLLHGFKGNRADFNKLALKLQQAGHAVLAPDLRGHGESAENHADRSNDLRTADFQAMITQDMEAVKKFLIDKNNAGELNVDKLCIVGLEMGSVVALNFAARDWSWPVLTTGKQGQDVRALALISPEWSFKGLRIHDAVAHPGVRSEIAMLIVAGKGNSKIYNESRRLHSALERYHPAPPSGEAAEKQTLWYKTPQTSLQGAKLLQEPSMRVDDMILELIDLRLAKQNYRWSERRNPLE